MLNRLFDQIEKARDTAQWQAAFGPPQVVGDRTLFPVARVGYTFGLGFGQGTGPAGETEPAAGGGGEGGGAGGGASAKPLGAIVVTPEAVYFEEAVDASRVAIAGIALGALVAVQLFTTLRAIFARG
ncbi:MAG: spore germination protein GerW family protein [Anaerolineae bacterium]|jgi:uncharacterized spore protein YtfJ